MVGMGVTMKKTRLLSVAGRLATKEAVIWSIRIGISIRGGVEARSPNDLRKDWSKRIGTSPSLIQ